MDSNNCKFTNKKKSITIIRAFKPISQSVKVYEILLLPKKDLIRRKKTRSGLQKNSLAIISQWEILMSPLLTFENNICFRYEQESTKKLHWKHLDGYYFPRYHHHLFHFPFHWLSFPTVLYQQTPERKKSPKLCQQILTVWHPGNLAALIWAKREIIPLAG